MLLVQVNLDTLPLRPRIDLARFADVHETLVKLSEDPHSDVRLALTGNKHVNREIITALSEDKNEAIRKVALERLESY